MVPAVPVKPDVGLLVVVTVPPAPLMMLHAPVPVLGVLPARVTEVPQTVWSVPAAEVVGVADTVTAVFPVVEVPHQFQTVTL